jgi:hypothetical protein
MNEYAYSGPSPIDVQMAEEAEFGSLHLAPLSVRERSCCFKTEQRRLHPPKSPYTWLPAGLMLVGILEFGNKARGLGLRLSEWMKFRFFPRNNGN